MSEIKVSCAGGLARWTSVLSRLLRRRLLPASGAWADQHPARHVGASVDVSRRLPLPSADLCGYLIAIVLLRLIVGPILTDIPVIGVIHARGSHGNGWHAPRT